VYVFLHPAFQLRHSVSIDPLTSFKDVFLLSLELGIFNAIPFSEMLRVDKYDELSQIALYFRV
jgi:hypothetical protein